TVYFEYKVIIPEKYDALYEITNNLSPNHFFLAKEENKWVVLNSQGQITKHYPPQINKNLVNLPIKDKIDYDFISGNVKDGHVRLGKNNAGLIAIAVPTMTWSSYCR
ncbi:MAG: hypothetical protein NC410_11380, partial [Oscillibacter sp.]|nr:hypothetical protein [Oscillibacter sp.]